jgi:N-acetylglucosamine kinase-like BadF-type ATPase
MRYYVGVDGGGTKTEFVWTDEKGNVLLRRIAGSSNPNDIGKERMIADMVAAFLQNMPLDAERVDVCMGLSGLSFAGCQEQLKNALKQNEKIGDVDLCSDVQIALDAAFDNDGAIVILGTGNVGYVRVGNECRLVGGGGYMIDDSFSGYDLGRYALNAVLSAFDGRGENTLLTQLITQKTGLSVKEIVREVYRQGKAYVAAFAPFVLQAYEQGDTVAERILKERTAALEPLLWGVAKALGVSDAERCEIALFGGLRKVWGTVFGFLSQDVKEKFIFTIPKTAVVYGALKRARGENNEVFLTAFLNSYEQ